MQDEIKRWNACRPVKLVKVQNSCLIDQPSANSCCWSLPTFAIFLVSLELPVLFFWTSHGFKPKWLQDGLYSKWTGTWAAFCIKKNFYVFFSKYGKIETQKACRIFYEKEEVIFLDWIVRYLRCHKQVALVLRDYPEIDAIPVLVACHWIEEAPGLARPFAPIGPRLGNSKCPSYTSQM